ncbi:MAG: hypothetical protein O3A47_04575, partial [Chloroflexi bacterium]|nr:hypothetical protein [Chloroflexota bacterium]
LDSVCRKASERPIIDVLHAAVRRLWVIGAWATKAGASETKEGALIALEGPGEAGILPEFLQPDYVAAKESLSTDELRQALIEFREDYDGGHGGNSK